VCCSVLQCVAVSCSVLQCGIDFECACRFLHMNGATTKERHSATFTENIGDSNTELTNKILEESFSDLIIHRQYHRPGTRISDNAQVLF